jgi:hypothetical protein
MYLMPPKREIKELVDIQMIEMTCEQYAACLDRFNPEKKFDMYTKSFQRLVRWEYAKQYEFIKALRTGSIAIHLVLNIMEGIKVEVMDGMQRCSTILYYFKNPWLFITNVELLNGFEGVSQEAKKYYPTAAVEKAIKRLVNSIRKSQNMNIFNEGNDFEACFLHSLFATTIKSKPVQEGSENILAAFEKSVEEIKDSMNISHIQFFCSLYKLDPAAAAKLFLQLNTSSKVVDPIDQLAAIWYHLHVQFKDSELVKLTHDRHAKSDETVQSFALEEIKKGTYQYNPSDYLCSLTIALIMRFPNLFKQNGSVKLNKEKKSDNDKLEKFNVEFKLDSIGYNLVCYLFGLKQEQIKELGPKLVNVDLDYLTTRIFDSCEVVSGWVSNHINIFRSKKDFIVPLHSDNQIISLIGMVFSQKYDVNRMNIGFCNPLKSSFKEKLYPNMERTAMARYAYDIFTDVWARTTNGVVNNYLAEDIKNESCYLKPIRRTEWMTILDRLEQEDDKIGFDPKVTRTCSKKFELLYNYVYAQLYPKADAKRTLEFDHLHSFENCKNIGINPNALGNIIPLKREFNKEKDNLNLNEFYDGLRDDIFKNQIKNLLLVDLQLTAINRSDSHASQRKQLRNLWALRNEELKKKFCDKVCAASDEEIEKLHA